MIVKYIVPALMYPSFYGLIALAVYWMGSGWPLLALFFTPSWRTDNDQSVEEA